MSKLKKYLCMPIAVCALSLILAACTTPRPHNINDICSIFKQYPKWYWATESSEKRWGIPIPVQMAIIHQESHFNAKIKPPRTKLLWVIPWTRPSTSYGYTQALSETWEVYERNTGHHHADRDSFSDAVDFIGWYGYQIHRKLNIRCSDAFRMYLAYHEGIGGYRRGTYRGKRWLLAVAHKVQRQAWTYGWQFSQCRAHLKEKPWYHFW